MARCFTPNSFAIDTAIPNPLALKDPVGSLDSSFTKTALASTPNVDSKFSSAIIGVTTSPSETLFFSEHTGSRGAYLQNPGSLESSIELRGTSAAILSKSYFTIIGFPISEIVWILPGSYFFPEYAHSRWLT